VVLTAKKGSMRYVESTSIADVGRFWHKMTAELFEELRW